MKKALRGAESAEQLDARIEEMERKLDRLRSLYESFFMGTERVPPNTPRRDLNRLVLEMQQTPIGNATMRFRFQTLLQRWVVLTTYWNRTLREIEAGTFRRDLAKAHRHIAAKGESLTEEEALRMGIPASRVKAFVARQQVLHEKKTTREKTSAASEEAAGATAVSARPVLPAAPSAPSVPGLSEGQLEAFYQRYVETHVQASGAPPKTTLEQMRAKLQQELPRLMAAQSCERVELDLAVDGSKVRLRARPVRPPG